jgi:hypothetical protein
MFKEKVSKKRLSAVESKKNVTLDARHQSMVSDIQRGMEEKSLLEKEKKICLEELDRLDLEIKTLHQENRQDSQEYQLAWSSNLYYKDRLSFLDKKVKTLLDESKEIEYYENIGAVLYDYYDLLENQQEVKPKAKLKPPTALPPHQKNILEAFQIIDPSPPESCSSHQDDEQRDKMSLVDDYLVYIDPSYIRHSAINTFTTCHKCNQEMTCMLQDGIMICQTCGYQELLLIEQNRPVYRQSTQEASHKSYKRSNHFNEWISQITASESTDIPDEIFNKILQEIRKEKIKDPRHITYNKMREILKKLNQNRYYEHIYYIIYRINGTTPPNFSMELEEKLRNMFKEIQGPFLKHCPPGRKNFLSYSYVLYKFCQLLEKDEYLKHFSLLKSRGKLHVQDQIWKKICEEVNWEFIQSI